MPLHHIYNELSTKVILNLAKRICSVCIPCVPSSFGISNSLVVAAMPPPNASDTNTSVGPRKRSQVSLHLDGALVILMCGVLGVDNEEVDEEGENAVGETSGDGGDGDTISIAFPSLISVAERSSRGSGGTAAPLYILVLEPMVFLFSTNSVVLHTPKAQSSTSPCENQ